MLDISTVANLQLIIFTIFICGFILRKMNILTAQVKKGLSDLLIHLILPCNIIYSFEIDLTNEIIRGAAMVLVIAFLIQLISYGLGKFLYNCTTNDKKKVLRYGTICSNAGFMGNPIIEGIYGAQGLVYASVYLIPLRIFMWSAGLSCFTETKGKEVVKKLLVHPCIIAAVIGFVIMLTDFRPAYFINRSIQYCSSCTLPISMLVIGSILAEVNLKRLIRPLTLYYALVRLILIPGITLGICMLLHTDALTAGVCIILAGMPAGSTTAILAEKYDGNAKYASECIFLTTVLSIVTLIMESYLINALL